MVCSLHRERRQLMRTNDGHENDCGQENDSGLEPWAWINQSVQDSQQIKLKTEVASVQRPTLTPLFTALPLVHGVHVKRRLIIRETKSLKLLVYVIGQQH